ncbi:MAG: hypothetical protein ABGX16_25740 [Pirellulales bacterium]
MAPVIVFAMPTTVKVMMSMAVLAMWATTVCMVAIVVVATVVATVMLTMMWPIL